MMLFFNIYSSTQRLQSRVIVMLVSMPINIASSAGPWE